MGSLRRIDHLGAFASDIERSRNIREDVDARLAEAPV
jgi:hypothetical protein